MPTSVSSTTSGTSLLSGILASGSTPSLGTTASTTSSSANLSIPGLASGMDWSTVVTELAQAERAPETEWQSQQSAINAQNSVYSTLSSNLTTLQTDVQALQDSSLYSSTAAQSSNSAVATVTSSAGATQGNFTFSITQLATAAQLNGTSNIAAPISASNDVSGVTLGTAGFSTAITAGTFSVNGAQVTVATTDSLQQVFDKIATATGNAVTGSYDSTTDKISLTSANPATPIVLGSSADTSNFLSVAQLYNNQSGAITSNAALGSVQLGATMSGADLATPVTDGGSGAGQFTINGVAINYNASTDSIQNVLTRINSSTAGVSASYDSINDRFVLTDKTTGDVGISAQDVTGNFLAATGMAAGTLQAGKNLLYTLNGNAQQLVSSSNTISASSSNLNGVSVTALQTGNTTVSVTSDTSQVTAAIQKFVTDYNTVQTAITSNQIVTTSSSGTVTPGTLTGDQTANHLASSLRSLVTGVVPGLSGVISMLSSLGIQTNGKDNTLAVDTTTLTSTVASDPSSVQKLFNDPTNGLATLMNTFITAQVSTNGTITNHQASLSQQSSNISTQIANLETKITTDSAHWTSEFVAMEQAEAQASQTLTYLSAQVTNGSL